MKKKYFFILFLINLFVIMNFSCLEKVDMPAKDVLTRTIGFKDAERFEFKIDTAMEQSYSVKMIDNKVLVTASSQTALCRGAYDYLYHACNSIVSWSGNKINIPDQLPEYSRDVQSPFQYRYYFNVVTHGYSTAYWDWNRWEKELDWMAFHGMNMPLLPGAHESILRRVFEKIGLTEDEIDSYFTGPAHFPWNKMGNITRWDGNIPKSFYDKQIQLNHKILKRAKELNMYPIIPAFAGFVPSCILKYYPNEKIRELNWGGFNKEYHAWILQPGSSLFLEIGNLYIEEYEKEFGKQEFYLADSFNEMDVPLSDDENTALEELTAYGESVYQSISKSNSDAVWVMQGWTFPYQKKDGKLFWTPDRLQALISKIPDDKLLILDLANEYNKLWWNIPPSWEIYPDFFGKKWIYSFIPNMGGKTSLNGRIDLYASMPFVPLNDKRMKNLVGFGFAPEGIENNEIIYELLAEAGWSHKPVNLDKWIEKYTTNRYGICPENMKKAFELFQKSCFGSFTDHPRHTYQFRPDTKIRGSINQAEEFEQGVSLFLSCKDNFRDNSFYRTDVIEFTCQFLGLKADELLEKFQNTGEKDMPLLESALKILSGIDRLLESHPTWKLERWITFARKWGDLPEEKNYYESNAKRLITTWGGGINEYAAKTWSGLIRDYYLPRWQLYYHYKNRGEVFNILAWEEKWIETPGVSSLQPFDNPVEEAFKLFNEHHNQNR